MDKQNYASFFSEARGEIAYIADLDSHTIVYMTPKCMELMGIETKTEYEEKKCYQILQGFDEPCEFCNQLHHNDTDIRVVERYNPLLKKWMRLENYLFQEGGHRYCSEWITDISPHRNSISTLWNQLQLENVLLKSIRTLATEPNANTAVNLFLQYLGQYYQADRAYLFELDSNTFRNTYEWCAENVEPRIEERQNISIVPLENWITLFQKGETIHIPSISALNHEERQHILNTPGVETMLLTPLRKNDTLIGFLGVDNAALFADDDRLLYLATDFIIAEFQKRHLLRVLENTNDTDRLTGVYNRRKYMQLLNQYTNHPPSSLGVCYIDLNGLKDLNEQVGYDIGDDFLYDCAKILSTCSEKVFRVDGDEFIILHPDIEKEQFQESCNKLRQSLKQLEPNTVSLGVAWSTRKVDPLALVSEADEMMFAEKQIYYRNSPFQSRRRRGMLAEEVLSEIRDHRFEVYYQPQICAADGSIFGAEALVRKRTKDGSLISPDRFVPIYENEGIISHMDFHVLEQVCSSLQLWRKQYGKTPKISVNFSRVTLMEHGVVERIREICSKYEISPSQIMIEVTESVGKLSHEQLYALVTSLQKADFPVSLDDFGSRYSNLSILTYINFQLIKLDKSLIDRMEIDKKSAGIIQNLILMCQDTIHTPVLAEGVETAEQLSLLQKYACDYVQGYYFSKPIPVEEFAKLLKEEKQYSYPEPK